MDFLSVVEDTRSVGGNSGEQVAASTRCKEGFSDKLNMLEEAQGYPTETHKDEDEQLLMLHCDEDINGCDWSPPLAVQLVEDNSSNQQEQGKENEEEASKQDKQLAAKEDDQKGDLKTSSSSEEDVTNTNNNSNSMQLVVEECTKDLQKKEHPLYALRRNPKRSRRFIDQEYALDSSAPAAGAATAAAAVAPKKSTTSIFTEKARACTECGKEFSSWKALFGHMRCHPEREWRGIQRPDNLSDYKFSKPGGGAVRRSNKKPRQAPIPTPLLLDDDQDEQLEAMYIKVVASDDESDTESIEAAYINGSCNSSGGFNSKGKIITGKRSKRSRQQQQMLSRSSLQEFVAASTTATTDTTPAEIKEERDMARCLVMLACAGRMSSSSLGFEDEEDEEGTSTTNHIVHEYNDAASGSSNGMEEDLEDEEVTGLNNAGELEQELQDEQQEGLHHFHQAVQHATGLKECMGIDASSLLCANGELLDHDFDGTRMKYECSTCKRIFKSHQALGGHRASHKKVKGCFAKTNLTNTDGIQQQQQQESADEDITDEEFLRSDEQLLPLDFHEVHHLHQHHHHHSTLPSSTILAAAQAHPHNHAFDTATGISNSLRFKDEFGDTNFSSSRKLNIKGHECSICHRVFTSGQALGGHKRCHWGGTERPVPENLITSVSSKPVHLAQVVALADGVNSGSLFSNSRTITSSTKEELLDLNLPALVEDGCEDEEEVKDVNNNDQNNKKNSMEVVYKLPQPVPSCALKRNSGAFSGLIEVMNTHNTDVNSHQERSHLP